MTKGSEWLGEELVNKMTKDQAIQLLTEGGISKEMAEWFVSTDSHDAIIAYGRGTSVGVKAAVETSWQMLKERFGVRS